MVHALKEPCAYESTIPGPFLRIGARALATAPRGKPKKVSWDEHSLMVDGKRIVVWSGEIHPFRLPNPSLWRDVIQKMKALGFNGVAFYFDWGYHSPAPGVYDFNGIRNVERAIEIAEEEGMYIIARTGPYVNAELTGGGYPGWMFRNRAEARTDDPVYLAASDEWMTQINAIIARHQVTTGGGNIIAYQLENELGKVEPKHVRQMEHLAKKARADGITVPFFHNAAGRLPDWTPKNSTAPWANPGPTDLYAFDGYPGGTCNVHADPAGPNRAPDWGIYGNGSPKTGALSSPRTPGFAAELGGGWFDYWGSNGTYACTAERQGKGYQRVFYGTNLINRITIHNIYMTFGGTSWGWLAGPVVYTSYDYGAPIAEDRGLRPKALALKQQGMMVQAAEQALAQMDKGPVIATSSRTAISSRAISSAGSASTSARGYGSSGNHSTTRIREVPTAASAHRPSGKGWACTMRASVVSPGPQTKRGRTTIVSRPSPLLASMTPSTCHSPAKLVFGSKRFWPSCMYSTGYRLF